MFSLSEEEDEDDNGVGSIKGSTRLFDLTGVSSSEEDEEAEEDEEVCCVLSRKAAEWLVLATCSVR